MAAAHMDSNVIEKLLAAVSMEKSAATPVTSETKAERKRPTSQKPFKLKPRHTLFAGSTWLPLLTNADLDVPEVKQFQLIGCQRPVSPADDGFGSGAAQLKIGEKPRSAGIASGRRGNSKGLPPLKRDQGAGGRSKSEGVQRQANDASDSSRGVRSSLSQQPQKLIIEDYADGLKGRTTVSSKKRGYLSKPSQVIPSEVLFPQLSEASLAFVKVLLQDLEQVTEYCDCDSPQIQTQPSCRLCFQTFRHKTWCPKRDHVTLSRCGMCCRLMKCPDLGDVKVKIQQEVPTHPLHTASSTQPKHNENSVATNNTSGANVRSLQSESLDAYSRQLSSGNPVDISTPSGMSIRKLSHISSVSTAWWEDQGPTPDGLSVRSTRVNEADTQPSHTQQNSDRDRAEKIAGVASPSSACSSKKSNKKASLTAGVDWSSVHKNAYLMALSTARAKHLLQHSNDRSLHSLLSLNISNAYVYSYYNQKPSPSRLKSPKLNVYAYYPKQRSVETTRS